MRFDYKIQNLDAGRKIQIWFGIMLILSGILVWFK